MLHSCEIKDKGKKIIMYSVIIAKPINIDKNTTSGVVW